MATSRSTANRCATRTWQCNSGLAEAGVLYSAGPFFGPNASLRTSQGIGAAGLSEEKGLVQASSSHDLKHMP